MILVVTGSRTFGNAELVDSALAAIHSDSELSGIEFLVSGHSVNGADRLAEEWADRNAIAKILVPAPWQAGRMAGLTRNTDMLQITRAIGTEMNKEIGLIAFPKNCKMHRCSQRDTHWTHGTRDCWAKAVQMGIKRKYVTDEVT